MALICIDDDVDDSDHFFDWSGQDTPKIGRAGGPTGPRAKFWNVDKEAELSRLWGLGVTASDIAGRIGATKGMVCGKARRLDLPMRDRSLAIKGLKRPKPADKLRPRFPRARVVLVDCTGLPERIVAHCAAVGVSVTRFGIDALGDGHLIIKLRRGGRLTQASHDRVEALLALSEVRDKLAA